MIALENVGLAPRSDLNEQFPLDPSRTALIVVDMQYLSGCRTIGLGKRFADAGQGRAVKGTTLEGRRRLAVGSRHERSSKLKKSKRLRELFDSGKVFTIAGGSCAFHAKMAEAAGFECAYMSGGYTSSFLLGLPDAGLMTLTEMVENARRMARATSIPLLSDADQGYGNALNVRHTVDAFIGAGVAGIHLEDQPAPKRCGFVAGKEVISLEEAAGKYRAAVDVRNELDPDFVIIARCDARTAVGGSLEETIRRLKAYEEAGVDVLYFEAPRVWRS